MIARIICYFKGHQWGPRRMGWLLSLTAISMFGGGEECHRCGKSRPPKEAA